MPTNLSIAYVGANAVGIPYESDMALETLGARLKFARTAAKLKQHEVAKHFGIKRENVSQWESDTTKPDVEKFPALELLYRTSISWLIEGVGEPPSPENRDGEKRLVSSFDPDQPDNEEFDADWSGDGAGLVNGHLNFNARWPGGLPEIAARAGAGVGAIEDDRGVRISAHGIATGHPVVNEWVIPNGYIRNGLGARPSEVIILPVVGHSMEPILRANDRVLVDTSQNIWMGDAVYVIDDGDTVLRVKTVQKVTSSNPPKFRIVSEASPDKFETLEAGQFHIVGRVVGRFSQM